LLTNSVELCGHDRDTTERVRQDFSRLEAAFYGALMAARGQGELGHRVEPKELALFLTSSLQGLRVMSKVYPSRSALRDIAKVTLSVLD
jgi:TetR/AcrR family transcriptional repressor of nem operon